MAILTSVLLTLALAAEPTAATATPVDSEAGSESASAAQSRKDVPIPEKIPTKGSESDAPTVSIRTGDNGDLIEEYRQNGRVTMVRVKPQRGPTYTLMDSNGDGRLDEVDGELNGGVVPVYYTIYEWN